MLHHSTNRNLQISFVILLLTFLVSCDKSTIRTSIKSELNVSEGLQLIGEQFASSLRSTISNLNKSGVDYSDVDKNNDFRKTFYRDWYNAAPTTKDSIEEDSELFLTEEQFNTGFINLTQIQIEYIQKIIKETQNTSTTKELLRCLSRINDNIYKNVPLPEQYRLLYITTILYYGIRELDEIEDAGQMVPYQSLTPELKTKSEFNYNSGLSSKCRKFLATVWAIAVGEPTPAGEIVAAVTTVVIGGILMYEVITCKTSNNDNTEYCIRRFEECYSPIPDGCSQCLQFCKVQGYWPPVSTHQCY